MHNAVPKQHDYSTKLGELGHDSLQNSHKKTRPDIFLICQFFLLFIATNLPFNIAYSQTTSATSICFDNDQNFDTPFVYFWNPDPVTNNTPVTNWPGQALASVGDFFCYDFGEKPNSLNVIFSNNGSQQTGDLQMQGGNQCFSNGNWQSLENCGLLPDDTNDDQNSDTQAFTLYFKNTSAYSTPFLHYFDLNPNSPNSNWPGVAMQALEGNWYAYEFDQPVENGGAVISDNGANQTADLVLDRSTPCYQNGEFVSLEQCEYNPNPILNYPNSRAIYFVNTPAWENPTSYLWNSIPPNSAPNSNWPGDQMVALGTQNIYHIEIGNEIQQGNLIFSNSGEAQTSDLNFSAPNLCYNDGTWMTPEECGIPTQQTLAVGGNRKANRGTQLALTLPDNDISGIASWSSPAWPGTLNGNSVVTPILQTTGSFDVMVSVESQSNTFTLEVVSAIDAIPERPLLAKPLNFPLSGSVSSGDYEFEEAFPNITNMFLAPVQVLNDGTNDLIYVVDKPGIIWSFPNDPNVEESQVVQLLDIREEVRDNHEQGFISMAFHPEFTLNGFAYIYYIEGENDEPSSGGKFDDGVLQRITLNSTSAPTSVIDGSRVDVLRVPQVGNDHKGGKMEFHPENGLFFMSFGDGAYAATAGDPVDPTDPRKNNAAQETDNLLGTFIRIEMLATPVNGRYYSVPSDNPFVGDPAILDEIWSYGHRNPWRWSFQQTAPFTLWETEVGQAGFEEVNIIQAGKNYGWPICEGENHRGQAGGDAQIDRSCTNDLEGPIEGYFHSTGSVSIIGGVVYNGNALPGLKGKFLFGDYISKNIWTLEEGENKALLSDGFPSNIVSFGTDLSGDDVLVSTYGLEFGVSGIYRIVDRDAAAAVIPSKLSETGIFADMEEQFPVSGVIEYQVNAQPWLDGAKLRFFISIPNDESVTFSQNELWSLPIGSVLVKHSDIDVSPSEVKPFETSILFRQEDGWEAANYRWNLDSSEANLVTTTQVESITEYVDGLSVQTDRTVRAGGECSSCHTGLGGKDPRGLKTRQLNRDFLYGNISENQLDLFNQLSLFSQPISAASNYPSYVDPANLSAETDERARVYLDINCSSCHAGSLMNLTYGTALQDMDIMNRRLAGNQFRMLPFDHTRSVLHSFQVSNNNRMPRGTNRTNPIADELFKLWIDANDADVVSQRIQASVELNEVRANSPFSLQLLRAYDNGFEEQNFPSSTVINWASNNTNVLDVTGLNTGAIEVTPSSAGPVTITATIDGSASTINLDVAGSLPAPTNFTASALSSSSISLNWNIVSSETQQNLNYRISRSTAASGPFSELATLVPAESSYVDTGLLSSTRYYYRIVASGDNGSSSAVTTFTDTLDESSVNSLSIETGSNFELLNGESRQLIALSQIDDQVLGVTSSATWLSSAPSIISVSPNGLVTGGTQAGTATISAAFGGASTSINLLNRGSGTYLYFNNQESDWQNVSAYVFGTTNGNETPSTGAWPGQSMEASTKYGDQWFRLLISSTQFGQQQTEVVFNCGSADCKSNDLIVNTDVPAQWFDGGEWSQDEPAQSNAGTGTQLIINNGRITRSDNSENLTGRLFAPGSIVTLTANDVGAGQRFTQWEGSATPYIVNRNSPTTTMLVPSALSLTINGVFDTISDAFTIGRDYYRSPQLSCSGCHGVDGQGSPPITNLASKYTLNELTDYIANNMPLGNAETCVGECASETAKMLLADAFNPPLGVCDFNSLNDMIPPDRSNRLLTLYEYNNSVRDILGLSTDVDVTSANLPATIPINGFKTAADTVFTDEYAQGYVNAAGNVADLISNDLLSLTPDCGSNIECAITTLGKRVFRRPLSANDLTELTSVYSESGSRGVIVSLFSSPSMLYRSEVGTEITSGLNQGYYQLDDYEVASMLSYTFWGTTPDNWLMALADAGELTSASDIQSAVTQMIDDPRAEIALERFIEGWMDLEKEIGTRALSDELKADMKEETMRFVKAILFQGGTYNDLLTANYSYMTQRLANHYGQAWSGNSEWQQIFYSGDNAQRRGILGHASVLTIQSAQEKTHPVKRGLFVRKNLMCQEFPPPPLGAALDPESDPTKGVRHRFEVSHAQPGCDACHQYIDGIGFGLESYNAFGQFVRTELTENGTELPIDDAGYIGSLNSAETFLSSSDPVFNYQGLDQLSSLIANSAHGKSCFARQWFRYANGRRESADDSCTLQGFSSEFKSQNDISLKDLIIEFTQTPNYILRK